MTDEDHIQNKRICPDFWSKSIKWLSISGWTLLFISMLLFHSGRPQVPTAIERQSIEKIRDTWDPEIAPYFLSIMVTVFYISLMALFINNKRHKRKEDRYNISVFLLFIFSILGLSYYFFN